MHTRWNAWTRTGDFYTAYVWWLKNVDADDDYSQQFKCISVKFNYFNLNVVPIKSITIELRDHLFIVFNVSPFNIDGLFLTATKLFRNVRKVNSDGSITHYLGAQEDYGTSIRIQIDNDFLRNFAVLLNIHQDMKSQLSIELLKEIKNIIAYVDAPGLSLKHLVPLDTGGEEDALNPALSDSRQLIRFIKHLRKRPVSQTQVKMLHGLLSRGENPNQCDKGLTSLRLIITYSYNYNEYVIQLCKLMLAYGVRPEQPSPADTVSAVEYAFATGRFHVLKFFIDIASKPVQPPSAASLLFTADTHAADHKVISSFRFPKGELYTTLKRMEDLTVAERIELDNLYKKRLAGDSTVTFSVGENKFIDIIRHESGKIVGAVIHIIRFDSRNLWCNIDLELFDDAYQNYGIMPAITYRFPFSLQLLFPDLTIWIVFFSAHYASFKRVQNELAIPKYQLEGQVEEITDVLFKLFGYKLKLHHADASECYIIEEHPTVVCGEHRSGMPGLMEELYHQYRGDNGSIPVDEIKKRDVLVALPVAIEFMKTLQNMLAAKGLNFICNVYELAKQLTSSGLFDTKYDVSTQSFSLGKHLFWQGVRVKAKPEVHRELASTPVHKVNAKPHL